MGRQVSKRIKKENKNSPMLNFFGDLISFGTCQAIVINIFLIFLFLAIIPTSNLEKTHVPCLFKKIIIPFLYNYDCPTTGFFENCECPACGMTRAMSNLLHGNLNTALSFNKGIIILFPLMIIIFFINLRKWIIFYKKTKTFF
jgi:hypothetical protein